MRIPQYQAWNTKLKKMEQVLEIELNPEFGGVMVEGKHYVDFLSGEHDVDRDWWSWDDCEIRECTEFFDKQNKNIYEGDILGVDDPCDSSKAVVVFHEGAFKPQLILKREKPLFDNTWIDWNIIGNIYENSDLLKEQQCSDN
jgi:hypothetical protein